VEEELRREMIGAKANLVTGTVLITYDPVKMRVSEVLDRLSGITGLPPHIPGNGREDARDRSVQDVAIGVRTLDQKLYNAIQSSPELKNLIPAVLLFFGAKDILTQRPLPKIPYCLLLWWSFRSFMVFHSNSRDVENPVKVRPRGNVP
jgi:hypothetical protein